MFKQLKTPLFTILGIAIGAYIGRALQERDPLNLYVPPSDAKPTNGLEKATFKTF